MDKSEPSLAPGWLKGVGGAGHHTHSSSFQADGLGPATSRQPVQHLGGSHGEEFSPRYSPASSQAYHSQGRRDRDKVFERPHSGAHVYANFGTHRSRSLEERDWDRGVTRTDRDWDRDWDRDKDRFAVDDRDIQGAFRRQLSLGGEAGSRYERSAGPGASAASGGVGVSEGAGTGRGENGRDAEGEGRGGAVPLATALPGAGGLASSMQKAAFERNFPSLSGTGDRRGAWPAPAQRLLVESPRMGGGLGVLQPSAAAGEAWSSRLAELPAVLVTTVTQVPAGGVGPGASAAPPPPKMAEALQQRVAQGRLSPQSPGDSSKLEELAMRQSRQLIPMKPSMPFLREKSKSKGGRGMDARDAPGQKPSSVTTASQLPYRPGAQASLSLARGDSGKQAPAKPLVRQWIGGAPVQGMSTGPGMSTGVGAGGSTGLVGNSGGQAAGGGSPQVAGSKRPTIQLLDRHALPIAPTAALTPPASGTVGRQRSFGSGTGPSVGDRAAVEKAAAQNRSDFFNALRKKAGTVPVGGSEPDGGGVLREVVEAAKAAESGRGRAPGGLAGDVKDPRLVTEGAAEEVGMNGSANVVHSRVTDLVEAAVKSDVLILAGHGSVKKGTPGAATNGPKKAGSVSSLHTGSISLIQADCPVKAGIVSERVVQDGGPSAAGANWPVPKPAVNGLRAESDMPLENGLVKRLDNDREQGQSMDEAEAVDVLLADDGSEGDAAVESEGQLAPVDGKSKLLTVSEEEVAALMRSMGWKDEGNEGEDSALTEEEIKSFYTQNGEPRHRRSLSMPVHRVQPILRRCTTPGAVGRSHLDPIVGSIGSMSSGVSSSDSDSD